jgi:hypothetical protein
MQPAFAAAPVEVAAPSLVLFCNFFVIMMMLLGIHSKIDLFYSPHWSPLTLTAVIKHFLILCPWTQHKSRSLVFPLHCFIRHC